MARKLTDTESELLRCLIHARGCDGVDCEICRDIDLRITDGLPHATEDPSARFWMINDGLFEVRRSVENIFNAIESAQFPNAPGVRRAVHSLSEYVEKLREAMRLPLSADAKKRAEKHKRAEMFQKEEVVPSKPARPRPAPVIAKVNRPRPTPVGVAA